MSNFLKLKSLIFVCIFHRFIKEWYIFREVTVLWKIIKTITISDVLRIKTITISDVLRNVKKHLLLHKDNNIFFINNVIKNNNVINIISHIICKMIILKNRYVMIKNI